MRLDARFDRAVRLILDCPGAVLTSGIGKAGHVARKLSASFSSTGTPSHFLNPAEALHGDLGSIRKGDVVVILSYSGESDEILRMLSVIKKLGHPVIAVTSTAGNALARFSDVVLELGRVEEACPLGLAPSASTTAHAGPGRCAVPVGDEGAGLHRRRLCPVPPGRATGPQADQGQARP